MRKLGLILPIAATAVALASTSSYVMFVGTDGITRAIEQTKTDSISVADGNVVMTPLSGTASTLPVAEVEKMMIKENSDIITIAYAASGTKIFNPYAFEGVDITLDGSAVTVNSTLDADLSFHLSGSGGSLKVYSANKVNIELDNVTMSNATGAAINIQSKKKTTMTLTGTSTLSDGAEYSTPTDEKENGTLFTRGNLSITGSGTLNISSQAHHAVASSKEIEVKKGTINVTSSGNDGLHADGITIAGGKVSCTGLTGDGVDAGSDPLIVKDGEIDITSTAEDVAALKSDSTVNIKGGTITFSVAGAQSKGIKTKQDMIIDGGTITATMTGDVAVVDNDPSYCTALKPKGNFTMNGGTVTVVSSGKAGKGISVDGDATFNGGVIDIHTTGDGDTYTNTESNPDSYSATCISVDGNAYIYGGTFTLESNGTAGKALKVDLEMVIGRDGEEGPSITAKTTGAKFTVSSSSSGSTGGWGGGGRPGGGGWGDDNTDYANPKVIKAEGNLTINSGTLRVESTQDGGEGIESKATLTLNGGDITVSTVDDCMNAATHIQINGGNVKCVASGNDAVDSNGTMTIAGGRFLACGTRAPEESFDCDQNTFTITGGEIMGIASSCSSPTSSVCTQRCVIQSYSSVSQNTRITICDASGNVILSAPNLSNCTSGKLLLTSASFTQGSTYTVYKGGTVTGGETINDLTIGGTLSGGTRASTFTTSSMVTGSTGGW